MGVLTLYLIENQFRIIITMEMPQRYTPTSLFTERILPQRVNIGKEQRLKKQKKEKNNNKEKYK